MAGLHAARGGMAQHKNISGPRLRKIRCQRELTQNDLAAKLQLAGWWIDRAGLSKIEARLVRVNDYRPLFLAPILRVSLLDLFPAIDAHVPIESAVNKLTEKRR